MRHFIHIFSAMTFTTAPNAKLPLSSRYFQVVIGHLSYLISNVVAQY